jgi:hypothetical protein
MALISISKTKEAQGKISKEMVVQLACVVIFMLFVALWVLLELYG